MSDTTARPDPVTDPHAYVRDAIWPPLPPAFGTWLMDLTRRAQAGDDPDRELPVPREVLNTGLTVPLCYEDSDGTVVTTLGRALTVFGAEHLLYPEGDEADTVEIFEPVVALALANTADAHTVAHTYDPTAVAEMAAQLTAGEWEYHRVLPIHVDQQGRVTAGLNTLLAIVQANQPAPAMARYDTDRDEDTEPYTWRAPA